MILINTRKSSGKQAQFQVHQGKSDEDPTDTVKRGNFYLHQVVLNILVTELHCIS